MKIKIAALAALALMTACVARAVLVEEEIPAAAISVTRLGAQPSCPSRREIQKVLKSV